MGEEKMAGKMVKVREFIMEKDLPAVEELEHLCQAGLSGDDQADNAGAGDENVKKTKTKKKKSGMPVYVEQIGDPFARVRHAPDHVILVAEYGDDEQVVGVIKACVRMVSRGGGGSLRKTKKYVKAACLLGLRVSPSHRRLGIATELVRRAEEWCAARGAAYATMATTASNAASLALFEGRLNPEDSIMVMHKWTIVTLQQEKNNTCANHRFRQAVLGACLAVMDQII
uniref:N-acetyltransferase domain-containing protein n=1 Tax=Oryza brachyantha TaxID=4533 RepID=J3LA73_ORYBR